MDVRDCEEEAQKQLTNQSSSIRTSQYDRVCYVDARSAVHSAEKCPSPDEREKHANRSVDARSCGALRECRLLIVHPRRSPPLFSLSLPPSLPSCRCSPPLCCAAVPPLLLAPTSVPPSLLVMHPSTPAQHNKTPVKSGLLSAQKPQQAMTTPQHQSSRQSLAPLTPSASAAHAQSMQETFTVLHELFHEFKNHSDESALVGKIGAMKASIRAELAAKQRMMQEQIERITAQRDELIEDTAHPLAESLQAHQSELESARASHLASIATLNAEIARLEGSKAALESGAGQLAAQKVQSIQSHQKDLTEKAGAVSLYRNFSSLAWDYDAPAGVVRGTFHFEGSKPQQQQQGAKTQGQQQQQAKGPSVKSFEFDRNQTDAFDIANQLWGMIDAQYA